RERKINVYMSHGNHDFIHSNVHPVTYPDNVFIFPSEQINHFTYVQNKKKLATIYGFSYESQAITNNKAHEFKRVTNNSLFHIALLHGSIQGNNEHDRYAPFQLSDLVEKSFDYWALGHIHKRHIFKSDIP